jgi:arabinogalactan endo-1,4-beta-galactosidase
MVVETDWAESCSGVTMSEPSIPISVAGQQTWVNDIKTVVAGLTGSHGIGICYWEPGWVSVFIPSAFFLLNLITNRLATPVRSRLSSFRTQLK